MMRFRTLPLLTCLVLALAAAALSGVGALRKIASFQPIGVELKAVKDARGGVSVEVAGTSGAPGARPELVVGDRIVLLDGTVPSGVNEAAHGLRQGPVSHLFIQRGDEVVELDYHRPPLTIDYPYLLLALTGVFYFLVGLYTLLRHRDGPGVVFSLWCSASAALYLLSPTPPADGLYRLVYLADQIARDLLPALTLHLFSIFPTPAPWLSRPGRRRLLPFLYLPGAILLALNLDLIFAERVAAGSVALLERLDLLHLGAAAIAAMVLLARRLARPTGWEQRRQLHWVAIGVSAGYVPYLLLGAMPFLLGLKAPQLLSTAAVLPLAIVPLTFAYAILRYKLWDIEVIAREAISATVTLLLGVVGFGLVNLIISRGISAEMPVVRNLLSFAAGLTIAGLLVPTRHTLSSALERLQYRGSFGKRRALLSFGRELLHERDLGRLCTSLMEQIEEGVGVERVNLYLLQAGILTAVRIDPVLPPTLPEPQLAAELLRRDVWELATLDSPPITPVPQARLFAAGYRYAFPLEVRGRGIGVALISAKPDGLPLNSDDLDLIRHLLDQAALAIENAQLVGQLQRQLAEVETLKSYSEGIFESSPAGIAVLGPDRSVVTVNSAFSRIVATPREALIGRPIADALPVQPLPETSAGPVEISYCEPSGRERYFQVSHAPFEDCAYGHGPLSILVVHDVSERVAMEQALKEKDRLAALGMLAAGVAHEVNTPITGISSYAQMLLADTPEDDPRHGLLKKVEQQTFRAARIVNNLLDTARNRHEERKAVTLQPLLAECLDLMGDRLRRRGIEVSWEVNPGAGEARVWAAEGELHQVFANLLTNAVDAMTGGGRLTLHLATAGERVRIGVRDNGPGIPERDLAAIFEPFFSTKMNRGGTGLGLAISRGIVEAHQGTLSAESRAGAGACFTVELPRHLSPTAL